MIADAFKVHCWLGFVESIYENARLVELRKQELKVDDPPIGSEPASSYPPAGFGTCGRVEYDGIEVERHWLDLYLFLLAWLSKSFKRVLRFKWVSVVINEPYEPNELHELNEPEIRLACTGAPLEGLPTPNSRS